MPTTLLANGLVPNFSTGKLVERDVLVDGALIADVELPGRLAADEVVDCSGRIVSPGFIDVHMHEEDVASARGWQIGRLMARMGVTTCLAGNCGQSPQGIEVFSRWAAAQGGAPTNYLLLAGYNTYRERQGLGPYDAASPAQQRSTREAVLREVEAGALGVSFGLEYDPGITTEEMTEAVRGVAQYDPFVSIHFRRDCDGAADSIREMAGLSRETGVRVQVSHLSSLAGYGYMDEALELLAKEMAENPRLSFDTYPYEAFCTTIGSAVFDVDWRSKWHCDYDAVLFEGMPYRGQRATRETFEEVRRNHPEQYVICFAMTRHDIDAAIASPLGLVCSDGSVEEGTCHPRAAGTFPRVLGRYARDRGVIGLMPALRKMTLSAARRLGVDGRKGTVEPGKDADLVVFDPTTIADGSTFESPTDAPRGIDLVMVAGQPVWRDGADTSALPGRVLRRQDL